MLVEPSKITRTYSAHKIVPCQTSVHLPGKDKTPETLASPLRLLLSETHSTEYISSTSMGFNVFSF